MTALPRRPQPAPAVGVKEEPAEAVLPAEDQAIPRPSAIEDEPAAEDVMDIPDAATGSPDGKQHGGDMATPHKQGLAEAEAKLAAPPHSPAALSTPAPGPGTGSAVAGGATPQPHASAWKTPTAPIPAPPATPDTVSAAGGWQSMCAGTTPAGAGPEPAPVEPEPEAADRLASGAEGELPLSEDGSLPFYLLDAHEEPAQAASLFLFGKVRCVGGIGGVEHGQVWLAPRIPGRQARACVCANFCGNNDGERRGGSCWGQCIPGTGPSRSGIPNQKVPRPVSPPSATQVPAAEPGKYVSCCAVVRGLQRNIFFVPREEIASPEIAALEEEAQTDPVAARKKLLPLVHVRWACRWHCRARGWFEGGGGGDKGVVWGGGGDKGVVRGASTPRSPTHLRGSA